METRTIDRFPGYRFTSDGRIQSAWYHPSRRGVPKGDPTPYVLTNTWRTLKGGVDKDGYMKITLVVNGKRHYLRQQRVIAEAFKGPCPPGRECAHINGKKTDNRPDNLMYCTHEENCAHKLLHGTQQRGELTNNAKLRRAQVVAIRKMHAAGVPTQEIADRYRISYPNTRAIVLRQTWKHVE